jgi:hypothetical protein
VMQLWQAVGPSTFSFQLDRLASRTIAKARCQSAAASELEWIDADHYSYAVFVPALAKAARYR